jgi:hypothetical protein
MNSIEISYLSEEEENPFQIGIWLEGDSLAPPCQAEFDVVRCILELARPDARSVLFDLGAGDGRVCVAACEVYGCTAVGCEIESVLYNKFQRKISEFKLESRVTAIHGDLLSIDTSSATIIVLYLLPDAIETLKLKLIDALRRGAILICNSWGVKGLIPCQTVQCGYFNNVTLYKYDSTSLLHCD